MTTKANKGMVTTLGAMLLALTATTASAVAPSLETVIWRAQLTVGVCDAANAETSDPVKVMLTDTNVTVLNSPIDDFKRGSTATFDLVPFNPATLAALKLKDITALRISKEGSNGLMLCRVTLMINERTIYHATWPSPGYLLDNTTAGHYGVLSRDRDVLRASSYWQSYGTSALPFAISAGSIRKRTEAIVATGNYGKPVQWRTSGVSVARKDSTAVRVGVDLKATVNNWFDPSIDVDFDLRFSCSSGVMTVSVQNYKATANSPWYAEKITFGLVEAKINEILRKSALPSGFSFQTGICPKINVDAYGNVNFSL